jgi:hypothetical protein
VEGTIADINNLSPLRGSPLSHGTDQGADREPHMIESGKTAGVMVVCCIARSVGRKGKGKGVSMKEL